MAFNGTPQQIKLLRQAVDEYCQDCCIEDYDERLYVTELVSALFDLGALSLSDLRSGLEAAIGGRSERAA